MKEELSYILLTPYTIAKSRTGGVLSRLLSRLDLELVSIQMFAPTEQFAKDYAQTFMDDKHNKIPSSAKLLSEYVYRNFKPSEGRRHRVLLLLFRGEDAIHKLCDIAGALFPENMSIESIKGETIRDTYGDLVKSRIDPSKIEYLEPAVLTPHSHEMALHNLRLFAEFMENEPNIVENMKYPAPEKIERTLVIIKPDNWRFPSSRPGTILDMFSRTGLRIIGMKLYQMSVAEALEFYGPVEDILRKKLAPHAGEMAKEILEKEYDMTIPEAAVKGLISSFGVAYAEEQFSRIVEFMSGTKPCNCPDNQLAEPGKVKCLVVIYEGEGAINKIRDVLGPTDPTAAPGGTVRREFGSDVMVNTAHASDSVENAKREMNIVKIQKNNFTDTVFQYLKESE